MFYIYFISEDTNFRIEGIGDSLWLVFLTLFTKTIFLELENSSNILLNIWFTRKTFYKILIFP